MQRPNLPIGINKVQLNLLTVVNVEECQSCPSEESPSFHIHKAMFTLLLLDDLFYPRCSLVHQVPAPDAAVKSGVDLMNRWIHTVNTALAWSWSNVNPDIFISLC